MVHLIKKIICNPKDTSRDFQLSFSPFCLKSNLEGSGPFNQCHSLATHMTLRPSCLDFLSVGLVPMETLSSLECRCCSRKAVSFVCLARDYSCTNRYSNPWHQENQQNMKPEWPKTSMLKINKTKIREAQVQKKGCSVKVKASSVLKKESL